MKFLKYTGNPYLFISLYLLLIIEGQHFGGFYLLYLLLALPHGGEYALLSVLGILSLIAGNQLQKSLPKITFITLGILLMFVGLVLFFLPGTQNETFTLALPLLTCILCGLSCLAMILKFYLELAKSPKPG